MQPFSIPEIQSPEMFVLFYSNFRSKNKLFPIQLSPLPAKFNDQRVSSLIYSGG